MALAGFLTTAQTITGSHSDFPALLVAANFTNADANALDGTTFSNGGGNVIVYTDQTKTTRVPIEVVEFVTGGTPSVQIWAKHPTMQTGATFWIEADSVQVSQPAVTDTFGRNAVWSSFAAVWHMEEDPSAASPQFLDSTGNGNDASSSGSMTSGDSVAAKIDNGVDFDGINDFLDAGTNSTLELNTQTISCWINPASISYGSTGIIYSKSNSIASSGFEMGLRLASGDLAIAYNDGGIRGWYVASNSNFSTGSLQHCVGIRDAVSGNFRAYKNGSLTDTVSTTTGTISYSSDSALIANQIQNEDFEGVIDELQIRSGVVSSDQIAAEYDNQNAPSTFWTSSDWTTGGGITVTENTNNTNYTSNDPVVTLTGSISISETLVNSNYTSLNPTISLTGVVSITEATSNVNYTSLNPVIDLTGLVSVVESLENTDYNSLNPIITLTSATIKITEQIAGTQYQARPPSILLTPPPLAIVSTACFDGVIQDLSYDGNLQDLAYNGAINFVQFNGNMKELEFNGTIQTSCCDGSIKTDC